MNPTIVIVHNIVQANGKTIKENNLETQHNIPISSLVELEDGVRLFVVEHTRDCDGTPLYVLNIYNEEKENEEWDGDDYLPNHMWLIQQKREGGYGEESLTIVRYSPWVHVEDELPPEGIYVLVDIPNNNIYGYNNYQKNTDIGCIRFGLSQADRAKLPESDEKKHVYSSADEWSNNKKPYCWLCNMRDMEGQDIARWRYFE